MHLEVEVMIVGKRQVLTWRSNEVQGRKREFGWDADWSRSGGEAINLSFFI